MIQPDSSRILTTFCYDEKLNIIQRLENCFLHNEQCLNNNICYWGSPLNEIWFRFLPDNVYAYSTNGNGMSSNPIHPLPGAPLLSSQNAMELSIKQQAKKASYNIMIMWAFQVWWNKIIIRPLAWRVDRCRALVVLWKFPTQPPRHYTFIQNDENHNIKQDEAYLNKYSISTRLWDSIQITVNIIIVHSKAQSSTKNKPHQNQRQRERERERKRVVLGIAVQSRAYIELLWTNFFAWGVMMMCDGGCSIVGCRYPSHYAQEITATKQPTCFICHTRNIRCWHAMSLPYTLFSSVMILMEI